MSERKCSVEGCGENAVHEISYDRAKVLEEQGLRLQVHGARPPRRPGRVYLCEKHYRLWKKLMKKIDLAEKLARKGA